MILIKTVDYKYASPFRVIVLLKQFNQRRNISLFSSFLFSANTRMSFYDIFAKKVFFFLILTLKAPDNRLRQILSLYPH